MIVPTTTALISTASMSAVPSFVSLCSQLAPTASVLVSAAPLPTIQQIKCKQDTGSLPLLPYSCMAANCMLWTTYGALKCAPVIWGPNAVGLALSLYYMRSYIEYSPNKSTTLPGTVNHHVGGVLVTGTAATMALKAGSVMSAEAVGAAAVLFCIALFGSPLATLKTVIGTKSAESIPLPFTMASLMACFFWSITGIMELHDFNVIVPNCLGFLSGLAQLVLKLVYGRHGKQENNAIKKELARSSLTHEKQKKAKRPYSLMAP